MQSLELPGWRSTLKITPMRAPLALGDSIKLHGTLHTVAGTGHDTERTNRQKPLIVLIPKHPRATNFASEEWEAQWIHPAMWSLSDVTKPVDIFGAIRRIEVGPFHKLVLSVPAAGRYQVRISGITPLILKQTGGGWKSQLGYGELLGALSMSVRRWYTDEWTKKATYSFRSLQKTLVEVDTRWSGGTVCGWVWSAYCETNAEGLLALHVLEHLGIGATVSRGYGRIECSLVRPA